MMLAESVLHLVLSVHDSADSGPELSALQVRDRNRKSLHDPHQNEDKDGEKAQNESEAGVSSRLIS